MPFAPCAENLPRVARSKASREAKVRLLPHGSAPAQWRVGFEMEGIMERSEKSKSEMQQDKQERCVEGRDWEGSEWFRRWLELIRGGAPQGAAN